MDNWKIDRARELAVAINASGEWDQEMLAELCGLAGLSDEWDAADGEDFEGVAYKAAKRLGVVI